MILNKLNVFVTENKEAKINRVDIDMENKTLIDTINSLNSADNSNDGNENNADDEEASASRNVLVKQLLNQGTFNFAGYIENEVTASALVLFKNLAKYYEIPFYEVNKISTDDTYKEKLKEDEYTGWLPKAVEDFGLDWQDVWEPVHKRMDFCYKLAGIAYNKSIAASGVIMATGHTILPVHDGAIGYDSTDLEKWGYIKYDLLSVNTLNSIQYFKGVNFDWNDNYDKNVWDSIKDGDLDFTFQLSGFTPRKMCTEGLAALDDRDNAMAEENEEARLTNSNKKLLKESTEQVDVNERSEENDSKNPGVTDGRSGEYSRDHWYMHGIDRISEVSSINRPGPLSIDLDKIWVKICEGNYEVTDKNDMIIEKILKSKFGNSHMGIIAYQEDIMGLCTDGSDFTLAQADDVRKGMGKKKQELIDAKAPQFINNWKYKEIFEINGLGFFKSDDEIELTDGSKILASELYERLENGEAIDVKEI